MVNNDWNYWGVIMVVCGDVDVMVIGLIWNYLVVFDMVWVIIDFKFGYWVIGVLFVFVCGRIVFVVDMVVIDMLNFEEFVDIVEEVVYVVCKFGYELWVVMLVYFIFGYLCGEWFEKVIEVVKILD